MSAQQPPFKEGSPPPPGHPNAPTPTSPHQQNGDRRTSFNFLRRQKSSETGKMLKKQRGSSGQYNQQPTIPAVPPQLPTPSPMSKIPGFGGENARPDSYAIATNSMHAMPMRGATYSPPGAPVQPPTSSPGGGGLRNGDSHGAADPYARTESMTHRGRYSYASSAISHVNSPRRVRRRKDPTPFNILVIGEQNSGKTSFIEFLRNALSDKKSKRDASPPQTALPNDSAFTPFYLETDIDHERIGVTLWDSQGLEKKFVDLQLREMASFLESKFEETFTEEQKVVRAPGVRDTHIHCVFLILDPMRLNVNVASAKKAKQMGSLEEPARLIGALDEDLDIQVLRTLQGKTTVIPVISKADTITTAHMALLKKSVWASLKQCKFDPLEVLNVVDESSEEEEGFDEREEDSYIKSGGPEGEPSSENMDDAEGQSSDYENDGPHDSTPPTSPPKSNTVDAVKSHRRSMSDALSATANDEMPFLPMSIISPDSYDPGVVGRRFPWGFADPYNQEHCDFVRLKDAVFSEWRAELREASREVWYEGWRTSRLRKNDRPSQVGAPVVPYNGRKTSAASRGPHGMSSSPEVPRGQYGQAVAF